MTESTDIDTLRIIADSNLDRLTVQRSAIERLETKGAILLGFAVTAAQLTLLADDLIIGWRIAAIVAYAASFLAGLAVVAPFKHAHPPEPKVFYDRYHTAPPAAEE